MSEFTKEANINVKEENDIGIGNWNKESGCSVAGILYGRDTM